MARAGHGGATVTSIEIAAPNGSPIHLGIGLRLPAVHGISRRIAGWLSIESQREIGATERRKVDEVFPECVAGAKTMKYHIRSLGYDAESDVLDLLINSTESQKAESIAVDYGIHIRRELDAGDIVGAFIRGYRGFAHRVQTDSLTNVPLAEQANLKDIVEAIVEWQREVGQLSQELAAHLNEWPPESHWLAAQLEHE